MAYKLLLVSASASRGEPANSDLVFNLDVQQLPDFSKTEIWKDINVTVGSPLRDRYINNLYNRTLCTGVAWEITWEFTKSPGGLQLHLVVCTVDV